MRKGMRNNEIALVIKAIKNGDDAKTVKEMFKDKVTPEGIKNGIKQAEEILTAQEEQELAGEERAAQIIAEAEERAAQIVASAQASVKEPDPE